MSFQMAVKRSALLCRPLTTSAVLLSPSNQTHYEQLGVPFNATKDEIRTAFVGLSKKHHPDVSKSQDANTRFSQINEAYSVLMNPASRYQYDMELYVTRTSANRTPGDHTQATASAPFGSYNPGASPFTYARDYKYYDNLTESEWTELYNKSNPKPNHFRVVRWLILIMFVGTAVHSLRINSAHKQFKARSEEAHRKNKAAYDFVVERAKNSSLQEQLNRLSKNLADEQR